VIDCRELLAAAANLGLLPNIVEKDYVLSWLFAGIFNHPALADTFGLEHPNVALSLNNLAALYRKQGRYVEAELLFKRSLAIREKALGLDHPAVAESLNSLAALYKEQGRYAEAEPLYKRALAILEKTIGPVATSLNNRSAPLPPPPSPSSQNKAAECAEIEMRQAERRRAEQSAEMMLRRSEQSAMKQSEQLAMRQAEQSASGSNKTSADEVIGTKKTTFDFPDEKVEGNLEKPNVERFPTIESPGEVSPGQEFAVQVSLTEEQLSPETRVQQGMLTPEGKLRLALPESDVGWKIDVVLSALDR
jgi:tetratricopeptide (TPR) repeat protein